MNDNSDPLKEVQRMRQYYAAQVLEDIKAHIRIHAQDGTNNPEVRRLLRELHSAIWIEACYDPLNEETKKYAERLLPAIRRLNDILGFKE